MGFGLVPLPLQQPRECHRGTEEEDTAEIVSKKEETQKRSLLRNLTEKGKAQLRKIMRWAKRKKEKITKDIKGKRNNKKGKHPQRKTR